MKTFGVILVWLCAAAGAMLALKEPAGVALFGLAVPVFALLWRWLEVASISEEHQRELHALRVALATLGDPDKLLHRLDELKERTEKTARVPDRLEELTGKVQKLVGDTADRLNKLEAFNSKLLTDEGLRRRLTFGRE